MNVFIKEQDLDHVLYQLIIKRKSFEEQLIALVLKQLENEASVFLLNFKGELEHHNSLKMLEDLYAFSEDIKDIYLKCINMFNKNAYRFKSEDIKEILSGIVWSLEDALKTYPKESDNRIEIERVNMVSQAIYHMKKIFKSCIEDYINNQLSLEAMDVDVEKTVETMLHHILGSEHSKIREIHGYSLKTLNLLDKRIECKKYISFITGTKKHLETFQSIDVEILQRQIDDENDVEIFKNIIAIIKGLYHKLDSKEKEMYTFINNADFSTDLIVSSYGHLVDYTQMVQHVLGNDEIMTLIDHFQSYKYNILNELTQSIMDEVKKIIVFSMNDISSQSKGIQLLSCQTVLLLQQAHDSLKGLQKVPDVAEDEIKELINVLIETIGLKYETIKEKDLLFNLSKKEQYVAYEKQLIDFKTNLEDKVQEYFEKMISESKDNFLKTQEAFERIVQQLMDKNAQADLNYLKTDLLFEVVTLEELVKFCLPKLQAHKSKEVQKVAEIINICYDQIQKNILQLKIESIEPEVHERFNGKEHEIILAEEKPGFLKGEVVALHTKGYKYKGIPIVRANIVAAK